MEETVDRGARRRKALRGAASIAIGVVLLVGVLPRLADLGDVWSAVDAMTWAELGVLFVAAVWNILTYQFVMMSALPGLRWRHAFMAGQITTAVSNTVPGGSVVGIAVTYGVLSSFGHRGTDIARATVLTGWFNTLMKFTMPIAAMAMLSLAGEVNEGLLTAAAVGLVLLIATAAMLVAMTGSDGFARAAGRWSQRAVSWVRGLVRRSPVRGWETSFSRFRQDSADLLHDRWALMTVATVVSSLSLFGVLLASMRALGVGADTVPWPEAFGAYAFVTIATIVPITPGGIGLIEVGLAAGLVIAGAPEGPAVAAVLVYRTLTYVFQVVLGILSWVVWRTEAAVRNGREVKQRSAA